MLAVALLAIPAGLRADAPPWTALDPPGRLPPPTAEPTTGASVGVRRGGRVDEARRIVLRVLEALRARDTSALEALVADPLARLETTAPLARHDVIQSWLTGAAARGLGRGADLADYVDLAQAQVSPATTRPGSRLRPGDLVVTAQLRARPGQGIGMLSFEHGPFVRFVVRLAPDGRVVGL